MANKRIIAGIGVLCALAGAIGVFLIERNPVINSEEEIKIPKQKPAAVKPDKMKEKQTIKSDLYSETPYYVPMVSITEISKLKPGVKQKVDEILENSQGFYFLKHNEHNGETIILLQNPATSSNNYARHNLQMAVVSNDGKVSYKNIGYSGEEGEIDNVVEKKTDNWEFDTTVEPYRPLKHIAYDKRKKVIFTETWNYDENEPIKYEMKNSDGKVVSMLKETTNNGSDYHREHIFYDNDGNTVKSLSANYEGADIKWFTYYDSENPQANTTIESVYENGLKTEEKVYNQDFLLENTLKANYKNGERTSLILSDSDGKEIETFEEVKSPQ